MLFTAAHHCYLESGYVFRWAKVYNRILHECISLGSRGSFWFWFGFLFLIPYLVHICQFSWGHWHILSGIKANRLIMNFKPWKWSRWEGSKIRHVLKHRGEAGKRGLTYCSLSWTQPTCFYCMWSYKVIWTCEPPFPCFWKCIGQLQVFPKIWNELPLITHFYQYIHNSRHHLAIVYAKMETRTSSSPPLGTVWSTQVDWHQACALGMGFSGETEEDYLKWWEVRKHFPGSWGRKKQSGRGN